LATPFVLKEVDGMPSKQICAELDISTTNNLWVMLSRARMRLRDCLEHNWFAKTTGGNNPPQAGHG
jgi:RNA polymerase sigma-70 factor (ECF subfamily)